MPQNCGLQFWLSGWFVSITAAHFSDGTYETDANFCSRHTAQVDTVGNWHITGVQLEVGEQATPFEHRSYADELY